MNQIIIYVILSSNNTILVGSDFEGKVLFFFSGGSIGYKGARRSSQTAAAFVIKRVVDKLLELKVLSVVICFKGFNKVRNSIVQNVSKFGIEVSSLVDLTTIPHNGCKPTKRRRL
uniref:30S ribosomal protein S11 n=1 Tax=Cyanidium caldarium TaxID=2771 RepID=A0A7H0WBC6_CYACA|nr:30S ribosomal protein S11 [Cyanidium caldarium]QNR39855.1 30S ribosomal protein S11 [Cyanidium caldarium]